MQNLLHPDAIHRSTSGPAAVSIAAVPAEVSEGKSRMLPPLPPLAPLASPVPPPQPPGARAEDAGRCANCLTPLAGPFCSQCGQHVADYHRSVWRFVADFFDSAFCWDNKFFRTLKPLLRQPGFLTQEFMAGRRVRYVHPLRLFLFTSAVCLALLQFNHHFDKPRVRAEKPARPTASAHSEDADDADDEKKPDKPAASVAPALSPTGTSSASPEPSPSSPSPANPADAEKEDSLGHVLRDTFKVTQEKNSQSAEDIAKRWEAVGNAMEKKANSGGVRAINEKIATNIQQKASWVALAMLPIFAWLMRFAYGKHGGYFFTHLVFSLHYHTFLLLFWTAYLWLGTLVKAIPFAAPGFLLLPLLLAPPWYLYLSLQRFYGETRFRTATKTLAIGGLHLLAIVIGVAIAGIGSAI